MRLTNFQSRAFVGALYVTITVFGLMLGQESAFLYIGLMHFFALNEFYKITIQGSFRQRIIPILLGFSVFVMVYANQNEDINLGSWTYWLIPLVLAFMIYMIFVKTEHFLKQFTSVLAGWIYISCSMGLLLRNGNLNFDAAQLSIFPYHGIQILTIFVFIWCNDTFAYLAGKQFGKWPLAKRISPKKTWEGFVGGALGTLLFALLGYQFFPYLSLSNYLILAVIVSISATLGDLFESRLKRDLNIKDSGKALGGHGGFLDRLDSVLFAGPACFFYLHLVSTMG